MARPVPPALLAELEDSLPPGHRLADVWVCDYCPDVHALVLVEDAVPLPRASAERRARQGRKPRRGKR